MASTTSTRTGTGAGAGAGAGAGTADDYSDVTDGSDYGSDDDCGDSIATTRSSTSRNNNDNNNNSSNSLGSTEVVAQGRTEDQNCDGASMKFNNHAPKSIQRWIHENENQNPNPKNHIYTHI
jgi:hypothetical protein